MAFRDDNAPDVVIEHSGVEVDYQLKEVEGSVQWFASFLDEIPTESHNSPSAYSYDDAPATISQVLAFENWSDGAGYVDAPAGTAGFNGYSYSRGVDASNGKLILSPAQQTMEGTSVAFRGYYVSPTFGTYGWTTTGLYKLSAGEWVLKYTGGGSITDLIEYGNSSDIYLFLAMGTASDVVYSTDGFATAPTAVTSHKTAFFAIRGNTSVEPVLAGITVDGLLDTSTNPIADGNWSNKDYIGSAGETVTSMVVANDLFWIFKEEGYYTFDGTNVGAQVPVDQLKRSGNGSEAFVWLNGFIYVNYANRVLKINPFDDTTEVLIAPAHPEVNGTITAITGDTRWLYIFIDNSAGDVYVLRVDPESGVAHTFMYLAAATCNAALLQSASADSVSITNPALIFNTGASTSSYSVLARDGLAPWEDSNYRYDIAGGVIYGPNVDGGAATFEKWLNGGRTLTESSTGARSAALAYSLDASTTYTTLLTAVASGLTSEKVETEISFTRLRYSMTLATGDNEHSPRVVAMMFNTTPNPPRYRVWRLVIDVGDQQKRRVGGEARPLAYEYALNHLLAGVGKRVTYTDYFGDSFVAKIMNATVNGVSRKTTSTARANAQSDVEIVIAEISQNTTIDTPFIWGASIWGGGGQWSEG